MSLWLGHKDGRGGRSVFSVGFPWMLLPALLALAVGILLPFLAWLFGLFSG